MSLKRMEFFFGLKIKFYSSGCYKNLITDLFLIGNSKIIKYNFIFLVLDYFKFCNNWFIIFFINCIYIFQIYFDVIKIYFITFG